MSTKPTTFADVLDTAISWALEHDECNDYTNLTVEAADFFREWEQYERLAEKYGRAYNEAVDRFIKGRES